MLTPLDYAERYRTLLVQHGTQSKQVRVEIYRIGKPDDEQGKLWQALKSHFAVNQKKNAGYTLTLSVNGSMVQFPNPATMLRHVVNPFYGKGSPEDCQITLEVAVLLGRSSLDKLQSYARKHIGLDCNGFVGNYIWHVWQQNAWKDHPKDGKSPGPSADIATIMKYAQDKAKDNGTVVASASDMSPENTYIFAQVDKDLKIIAGGPNSRSGHIVITQPKRFMAQSFVYDTMGFYDMNLARKNAYGHPAFYVLESTGPEYAVGLKESWYAIRPHLNAKKKPIDGVFNVFRGCKGQSMSVRIAPLP